jgi:hypothetical protein
MSAKRARTRLVPQYLSQEAPPRPVVGAGWRGRERERDFESMPPRPVVCAGSRERERDIESMLPKLPRPNENYQTFQIVL